MSDARWSEVPEYPGYFVSDTGLVKSPRKDAFKGYVDSRRPYFYVALCKNNKLKKELVHRLVAKAFVPNPDGKLEVNHKDGDKHNNNHSNLEWVTGKENVAHSVAAGLRAKHKKLPWGESVK